MGPATAPTGDVSAIESGRSSYRATKAPSAAVGGTLLGHFSHGIALVALVARSLRRAEGSRLFRLRLVKGRYVTGESRGVSAGLLAKANEGF